MRHTGRRRVTRLDVRHLRRHAELAVRDRLRYSAPDALLAVERDGDAVIIRLNSGGNALAVESWLRLRGYAAEQAGGNPDGYGCAVRVTVPAARASEYRCGECGHGEYLRAWAGALVEGPLGPDGHLESFEITAEDWLHEDSIDCSRHPGEVVEKFEGGQWCRWWVCPQCKGEKRVRGYECREPGLPPEPRTYGEPHMGWRPAEPSAAVS